MAGFELAEGFVRVRPNMRGFESEASKGIGGALTSAFSGSAVMGSMNTLGGVINKTIVGAVAVAGAAGGALLAKALSGGLKRVLDTEDATIAFQQMGLGVEEIDRILGGVDKTFDGTPFANPDGFNISAQLLASGRELSQVEKDLLGIANVTSQTLDKDLNRTSETFLKIAATGRVYARDLNSLAMQGIPMRNILADALGVSTEALNDMVSSGEVTFDMMMDAVHATERFDGAALSMGSSTRGAFANVMTGVSRLGESFLGPLFGQNGYMVKSLQAIRGALRDLTPHADALGEKFANWLSPKMMTVVEGIGPFISGLFGIRQQVDPLTGELDQIGGRAHELGLTIRGVVDRIAEVIGTVMEWVRENPKLTGAIGAAIPIVMGLASVINAVRWAFLLLIKATPLGMVMALVTGLVYAWQNSETFRDIVTGAFERVREVIATVVDFLVGLFETVVGWFRNIGQSSEDTGSWIGQTWEQVMGIFGQVGEIVGILVERFMEGWEQMKAGLSAFFEWSAPFWSAMWEGMKAVFEHIWNVIKSTITMVLDVIGGILDVFLGVLTGDWSRAWEGIKRIFTGVWDHMVRVFSSTLNLIKNLLSTALNFIKGVWQSVWSWIVQFIMGILNSIRNTISNVINSIRNTISSVFNAIRSLITNAVNGARTAVTNAFNRMRTGIQNGIKNALNLVKKLPGQILKALGNVGKLLFNVGKKVIQGFIDGIKNMFGGVRDTLGNLTSALTSWKGPPERDEKLLTDSGHLIMDGLVRGLKDGEDDVRKMLMGLTDMMGDADLIANVNANGQRQAMAGLTAMGGGDTYEIGQVVIDAKSIKEMRDVTDFFKKVKQTARAGAADTGGLR